MSSHHFVKEGQEPALLIIDAPAFEVAGPLLEWAPLVVVAQRAVDDVLLWNIKIDVVLAEEANVSALSSMLEDQSPLTLLAHVKEESPLINAMHFLIRRTQRSVNILTTDAMGTMGLIGDFADKVQLTVIDGTTKWSAITSGHFEKWMSVNSAVLIKPGSPHQSIATTGLARAGDDYLSRLDGLIRIESEGLFWVGETGFLES